MPVRPSARTPRGRAVLEQLRSLILTGRIAPGELLVEPALAERFSTSKTPVREALHLLAAERLVTVLPKKGYLVATMTAQDLTEVLDLRMLLEPHAAAEAASRATPQDHARLRGLLARQREAAGSAALAGMPEAADLHHEITRLAGSGRLVHALERCFDETARAHHVLGHLTAHMNSETELAEHEEVLGAIEAADPAAAQAAMRRHLRTIHDVTLSRAATGAGLWTSPDADESPSAPVA